MIRGDDFFSNVDCDPRSLVSSDQVSWLEADPEGGWRCKLCYANKRPYVQDPRQRGCGSWASAAGTTC